MTWKLPLEPLYTHKKEESDNQRLKLVKNENFLHPLISNVMEWAYSSFRLRFIIAGGKASEELGITSKSDDIDLFTTDRLHDFKTFETELNKFLENSSTHFNIIVFGKKTDGHCHYSPGYDNIEYIAKVSTYLIQEGETLELKFDLVFKVTSSEEQNTNLLDMAKIVCSDFDLEISKSVGLPVERNRTLFFNIGIILPITDLDTQLMQYALENKVHFAHARANWFPGLLTLEEGRQPKTFIQVISTLKERTNMTNFKWKATLMRLARYTERLTKNYRDKNLTQTAEKWLNEIFSHVKKSGEEKTQADK